jgi:lactoylglutathione lyase
MKITPDNLNCTMKNTCICLLFVMVGLLTTGSSMGQAKKPVLNHIARYVVDLKKATNFYIEVIGLDTMPEPFHDGKHTWFVVGDYSHLHLIQGAEKAVPQDKNNHLCFSAPSIEDVIARLGKYNVDYYSWAGEKKAITTRVDGIKQIYFQDPDGYWIEINNDYPNK